jgi:hypothetical protein
MSLQDAFEAEGGIIIDGVVLPDSVVKATRSAKPTYSGGLITAVEYYNSLTQSEANRVMKSTFTYNVNETIDTQTNEFFDDDGTTVLFAEHMTYVYSGVDLLRVEVAPPV